MIIQNLRSNTLGALKKAQAIQLKQQQRINAELRIEKKYKDTARSLLPDFRFIPKVHSASNNNISVLEQVQRYRGEMDCGNSVWAPWIKV